jgi:hypothetical protein
MTLFFSSSTRPPRACTNLHHPHTRPPHNHHPPHSPHPHTGDPGRDPTPFLPPFPCSRVIGCLPPFWHPQLWAMGLLAHSSGIACGCMSPAVWVRRHFGAVFAHLHLCSSCPGTEQRVGFLGGVRSISIGLPRAICHFPKPFLDIRKLRGQLRACRAMPRGPVGSCMQ